MVISASSRQVRIVHAFVDNKTGHIRAGKSPMVDFKGDMDQIKWLLSWMVADPVGAAPYLQNMAAVTQPH
jgi:hypothetical protein